ncbi:mitochondrial amino-acid acetyltransferase [Paraphoma chrysanthemicola]|uniref:Amino-acid acetyltransferase, mitochondrial n=1 Tax=Paraphoma chrysanthemicola TaxID=798071 RepID=A0A8K0QWT9_9PLEO|nr:mitochondrial amino-acid acetyltransferase [Paraphoma chrysanthemicola]
MFTCHKAPVRAIGKATQTLFRCDDTNCRLQKHSAKLLSTAAARTTPPHARKKSSSAKERQRAEREQLTRLLKESPGKRDARNFLKQFDAPKSKAHDAKTISTEKQGRNDASHSSLRTGVNLGNLYEPTVFTRDVLPEKPYDEEEKDESLHLALIKLRQPQMLDDRTLGGIALTLSQMAQLGLNTAVVLDCDELTTAHPREVDPADEKIVREQAARFLAALEDYNEPGAVLVEHALGYSHRANDLPSTIQVRGGVEVRNNFLLYPPLDDGVIPVLLPYAYDSDLKKVAVEADDVLLALVREFAGISGQASAPATIKPDPVSGNKIFEQIEKPTMDRIIILDPLGGIPSSNRSDGAHVFVNLEAEYRDIKDELTLLSSVDKEQAEEYKSLSLGSGNPFSQFVEQEVAPLPGGSRPALQNSAPIRHLKNLDVLRRALKLLPSTSSGLILTPPEAATRAIPDDARTSPAKNPLLHNILTDKPMVSSSLPTSPANRFLGSAAPNPATFLKRGVPLTMIPDPRISGSWRPPSASNPSIELAEDPRINFPKLEELINDSFRRKLHAKDYLARIRGRVAGIIIAGDYEGGAICTWETPSTLLGSDIPAHASDTPDSPYWVPYLDKFAVLTSSQGSGGVSDIVWAALTRTCFPDGVVWRSRTSNPVNKWYQERSSGTWNLPGGQWTMFWTTDGVTDKWEGREWGLKEEEMTRWDAYVDVCSGIVPSWADGIKRND